MFQADKLFAVYNIGSCELLTGWMTRSEAHAAAAEAAEGDGQPEVKLIRLDTWIEARKPTKDDNERRAWIAGNAWRPLSILNGVIDSWNGYYPVVDADGDLTGETVEANDHSQFGKYEVTPCGMAVIQIEE